MRSTACAARAFRRYLADNGAQHCAGLDVLRSAIAPVEIDTLDQAAA